MAGVSRARVSALAAALVGISAALVVAAPPASAADITTCPGNLSGTTFTLTADCATTEPLTVPDGVTIDGAGHTISATDAGGPQWNGGIVTNAGASMHIENVTITGPVAGFQLCTQSTNVLYGIFFNEAGGTVDNVTVDHIFQFQNNAFGSCQTGRAIRADNGSARTVTITNTKVMDYQKSGFESRGSTTMDISGSTAGPPHSLEGLSAQNAVSFVGVTAGRVENNTIHGSSDEAPGPPGCGNCNPAAGTGMLFSNADNVTVTRNQFVGNGTDIGVAVSAGSTGNTISFNHVSRSPSTNPANTDADGIGISVDPDSSATLICNTFAGWKPNKNIVGAIQIGCTPLPDGAECQAYSAQAPTVEGGVEGPTSPPFTWELVNGTTLPDGLTLAPDGAITGTPTTVGTFHFTLKVTDADGLTATSDQTITIKPGCTTPTPTPTVAPTAVGAQPTAAPTAVDAGLATAPDGRLPLTTIGLILLGAATVLVATLIGGRHRRTRKH